MTTDVEQRSCVISSVVLDTVSLGQGGTLLHFWCISGSSGGFQIFLLISQRLIFPVLLQLLKRRGENGNVSLCNLVQIV